MTALDVFLTLVGVVALAVFPHALFGLVWLLRPRGKS